MRKLWGFLAIVWLLGASAATALEPGFTALFDGKSFAGWQHGGNWTIQDGAFYRQAKGGPLSYEGASVPDDFELRFEWKVSAGCNSGVYYRPGQYEYQVLDNVGSPYGKNARHSAGALFFGMAPARDATKAVGEWNSGRVLCKGSVIEHWLNGVRVLSFDYGDPKWEMQLALLRLRGADLSKRGGKLWLQDHGQDVWYRNLRWRAIPAEEALVADPDFVPMPVRGEALSAERKRVRGMLAKQGQPAGIAAALKGYLADELVVVNPSVRFVQRTMKCLAGEGQPQAPVRVLFYGQSITAQAWRSVVEKRLRAAHPEAEIEFANKSIGGFTSPRLRGTAEHDLYPHYPDLLIFHVYGDLENYEAIIRKTRATTTAEIVLWTDHLASPNTEPHHDKHSVGIREIAAKYDCMLIDVRQKWRAHLSSSGMTEADFLKDSVHLNKAGEQLLGEFVAEELVRSRAFGENTIGERQIREVPIADAAVTRHEDGSVSLRFIGNRVLAIADGSGKQAPVSVTLDGRDPHSFPGVWAVTRPSKSAIWMPAIANVQVGTLPVAEDWTLTCLKDSTPDGKKLHFRLVGSVTGEDGEGWSTEDFTSRSGRIRIAAKDWNVAFPLSYSKKTLPDAFGVTWSTYPTAAKSFVPSAKGRETMLLQGVANGAHVLTLRPAPGESLGISAFRVYEPLEFEAKP